MGRLFFSFLATCFGILLPGVSKGYLAGISGVSGVYSANCKQVQGRLHAAGGAQPVLKSRLDSMVDSGYTGDTPRKERRSTPND